MSDGIGGDRTGIAPRVTDARGARTPRGSGFPDRGIWYFGAPNTVNSATSEPTLRDTATSTTYEVETQPSQTVPPGTSGDAADRVSTAVPPGVWTSGGPYGGYAYILAIDPTTSATLYAAMGGQRIFKSTDSAGTWAASNTGLTNLGAGARAIDPLTPATLYAGNQGGVFKPTDFGGTWAAANTGLQGSEILAVAINPTTPATLYAGTNFGVFKSIDAGNSWATVNVGPTDPFVLSLAINPTNPSTRYAGTLSSGVFKSTNAGGGAQGNCQIPLSDSRILAWATLPCTRNWQ